MLAAKLTRRLNHEYWNRATHLSTRLHALYDATRTVRQAEKDGHQHFIKFETEASNEARNFDNKRSSKQQKKS